MNPKKRLTDLLNEENIDLNGTQVRVTFPTSTKNLFSRRKRRLRSSFKEIERLIKEKSDPFYDKIEDFKEIGGYFLIRQLGYNYSLEHIFETKGELGKQIVIPGKGLDFRWSCTFPDINKLNIKWNNVIYFIKYHSHPFINFPHPKDIHTGIRDLSNIPKYVAYYQTIYSKIYTPNFFWMQHYW